MRSTAVTFATLCVVFLSSAAAAPEEADLAGVWSTPLDTAGGTDAQGWLQFSPDGTLTRLVLYPKPESEGATACQIAKGQWSAAPSGQSLIVTYTIEDYQPKQCLQRPGAPLDGCEPPPGDYQKTMKVRMVFAGLTSLTQYSQDGSIFAFTRAEGLPAIPRECYDAQ